jgi:chemotaxis methyl-accepting protein methylase
VWGNRIVRMEFSGRQENLVIARGATMYETILRRIASFTILGKCPVEVYLRLNHRIWNRLPVFLRNSGLMTSYGNLLSAAARYVEVRKQSFYSIFFRNRPQLELISRLASKKDGGSTVRILVLASSCGAEVYSIRWTIHARQPDSKVKMTAVDISKEVLDFGERGVYSSKTSELQDGSIFHRMTEGEMQEMFDRQGDQLSIKPWLKEGIVWQVGDAADPDLTKLLGSHDIVIANNFLCHMYPPDAERCLRNIAGLVKAGGHLFVSGIDLKVRTKVARDLCWEPVLDLMEDIHEGDPILRVFWPGDYTGLEPFTKRRRDWKTRYASVFRLGGEGRQSILI